MPFLRPRHDGTLALSAPNSPRRSRLSSLRHALGRTLVFSSRRPVNMIVFAAPVAVLGTVCVKAAPSNSQGVRAWTRGRQTAIRARPTTEMPVVAKVGRHMPLFVWGKYNGWYRVETHDHIFGWVDHAYLSGPELDQVREMSEANAKQASERTSDQIMFGTREALEEHYHRFGSLGALKGLKQHGVGIVLKVPAKATRRTVSVPAPRPVVAKTLAPQVRVATGPRSLESASMIMAPRPQPRVAVPDSVVAVPANSTETLTASGPSRLSTLHAGLLAKLPESSAPNQMLSVPRPPVVQIAPRKAPVVRAAAKAKPAKSARKTRESWRTKRYKARLAKRQQQRNNLRNRVGLAPKGAPVTRLQSGIIAPVSPEELMKARNSYLQNRGGSPLAPVENLAPLPGGSFAPTAPALISPASFNASNRGGSPRMLASRGLGASPVSYVVSNAQMKPRAKVALRGGSPRDRMGAAFGPGVAQQALSYRGMPYVFGSASPRRGFDCSGLVFFLLRQRGYNPPRTAAGYRSYGSPVARGAWQPGDLILFANTYKRGISHIGVYTGNNNFVHAATTGSGVRVDSLTSGYYASKYWGARRVK